MLWEFKVGNCWKGRRIYPKMCLNKNLATCYHSSEKLWTKVGEGKYKKGSLSHFIRANKENKKIQKH